jgi:hypothetical protein
MTGGHQDCSTTCDQSKSHSNQFIVESSSQRSIAGLCRPPTQRTMTASRRPATTGYGMMRLRCKDTTRKMRIMVSGLEIRNRRPTPQYHTQWYSPATFANERLTSNPCSILTWQYSTDARLLRRNPVQLPSLVNTAGKVRAMLPHWFLRFAAHVVFAQVN